MSKRMRILLWAAVALVVGLAAGYIAVSLRGGAKSVGVSMPMRDVDRWTKDGQELKQRLEAKGYKVRLDYAESDAERQIAQIQEMIDANCNALIIAASDCDALGEVLARAADKGIAVIAYDRLILNTEAVDYYCTFDNFEAGERQGLYLEERFGLASGGGPVTMEIFSGASDDSTSIENYSGQMSVLTPYIEGGAIVVRSGELDAISTAIADWSTENARARMAALSEAYYGGGAPDIVLSANDSMALGVTLALEDLGFGGAENPFPVITGMDCDAANVIAIIKGEQAMSLLCDTRALAYRAAELADDLLSGRGAPQGLERTRFHNGAKAVPTSICKTLYVDADNYREVLVLSGYYRDEDLR